MILVGDSLGMVVLGYDTTQPVTMDDMIHHCKAARRGAPNTFIVGDMPFGSYEVSIEEALRNAYRFIKDTGVDAIKLEGGQTRVETVKKLVSSGVAVMGHIGLTPQGISVLGGFRAQGRTAVKARTIVDDALALQDAGAFALVIECVPAIVAKAITEAVKIPTIGIGAGAHTSGQVLVYHDLLGILNHPHHEKYVPSFCKKYANLGVDINHALSAYGHEVRTGIFPDDSFSPYKMSMEEQEKFVRLMKIDEEKRKAESSQVEKRLKEADEYAVTKIY